MDARGRLGEHEGSVRVAPKSDPDWMRNFLRRTEDWSGVYRKSCNFKQRGAVSHFPLSRTACDWTALATAINAVANVANIAALATKTFRGSRKIETRLCSNIISRREMRLKFFCQYRALWRWEYLKRERSLYKECFSGEILIARQLKWTWQTYVQLSRSAPGQISSFSSFTTVMGSLESRLSTHLDHSGITVFKGSYYYYHCCCSCHGYCTIHWLCQL